VAPIGGIAGRAVQSEGSLVSAGGESSLLTTVAQTDPIWVRFALSVQEYDNMRAAAGSLEASTLKVELLGNDGKPYPVEGRINFTGSTVDTTLGTVQLRAEFANPQLRVLPGEYLRVRVAGGAAPAIAVPQSAVLQSASGPYVWVLSAESQAQRREVQTGAWVGEDWRIRSGLSDGDTLILDNLLKLKPGQPVTVQQATRHAREDEAAAPAATAPANAKKGAP
jgi:membrane fusion protein (multidrug efflux system)